MLHSQTVEAFPVVDQDERAIEGSLDSVPVVVYILFRLARQPVGGYLYSDLDGAEV